MVIEILDFEKSKYSNNNSFKRHYFGFVIVFLLISNFISAQTAAFNINSQGSCSPLSINLIDTSTGASSWQWDLGNSNTTNLQNPSLSYILPGVYTVSLTINGGGSANLVSTKTINVYPAPKPTISESVKGCEPFSCTLTASAIPVTTESFTLGNSTIGGITGGNPISYSWNFAGALPSVTQSSPILNLTNIPTGSYDVLLTVTDEHGCSNSVYKQNAIYVSPKPKANFTITKGNLCGVGKVTFTGTSKISSGSITSYAWDLDNDGTIDSRQKNFSHTFTVTGTYDIALIVTSDEGYASEKVVKQVVFNPDNSVDFSFESGCSNKAVSFTDKSSKDVSKWLWDFDNDGTVDDNTQNPSYIYTGSGTKTAKLKVIFTDGCEMETSKNISISEIKSNFTFNTKSSCAPAFSIAFNSTATVSAGATISSYAWDFDNDNIPDDITPNPIHNFNAAGTYPVRLTVTSSEGCTSVKIISVDISEANIDFTNTLSEGCAPLETTFSPIILNPLDTIVSYSWNFGDETSGVNNTSTESNPTHIYNLEGEYDVKLTAVTSKGCIIEQIKEKNVRVGTSHNVDSLAIIRVDSCLKSPVDFVATFFETVDKLVWDFGEGNPAEEQAVSGGTAEMSHTYQKPGIYTVTIEAWTKGCQSTITFIKDSLIIYEPLADFKPSSNSECTVPATISFSNKSISDPANTTWAWEFGDSLTSTDFEPTHTYNLPGDYKVTLTVTNTLTGCTDVSVSTINISTSNPEFTANNTSVCAGDPVEFINQIAENSSANYKAASYLWDFGDGTTSTEANPTHTYKIPGLYDVKLIVTEAHGCVDSIIKPKFINVRGPIVNFNASKTEVCKGELVTFTDLTEIAPNDNADPLLNQYHWDFGDGEKSTDKNPQHAYMESGNFSVSLRVTDNNGCVSTKKIPDLIKINPIEAKFSTTRDKYCVDAIANINFTNTATGKLLSYDWDLDGDGTFEIINGDANQKRIFPIKGDYSIKQRVRDSLGCEDTYSKIIRIVDGNADFKLVSRSVGCAPVSTVFEALDSLPDVASYLWDFGDGVTSDLRMPSHDFLRPGDYDVSLTVALIGGCTKTSTKLINIAGAIGNFHYNSSTGCAPHEVTFRADSLRGVTDLVWDFGDGTTKADTILAGDTAISITYTYKTSGSRLPVLILRDSTCGAFSYFEPSKRINISESPIAAFEAATVNGAICEQFNLQFTDLSTKVDKRYSITKWEWNFGDSTANSFIQNPTHIYNKPGKYTVILSVSNEAIDSGCVASISHEITVNPLPTATSPTQIQNIYTGISSKDIELSSLIEGTTYVWTRTNPKGIITDQPLSGNVSTDGKITGAIFENTTSNPISVTYTIIPIGPSDTYCNGDPLIATVTVNPNPLVKVLKSASKPIMNNNGTFSYNYTLTIINNSNIAIDSVQVYDNLDDVFKASGFSYKVTGIIASGNLIANGLFNGSSVTATLLDGKSLGALQQDSIVIGLEVDTHKQNIDVIVYNQALLSCFYDENELSILSDADLVTIEFEPTANTIPAVEVFIPDAFSPNKDEVNQHYVITHNDLTRIEFEVFNRWGSSVYKSANYQNDWDGKGTGNFLGKDLPTGTYYCIYKVINISTGETINSGVKYITLRR